MMIMMMMMVLMITLFGNYYKVKTTPHSLSPRKSNRNPWTQESLLIHSITYSKPKTLAIEPDVLQQQPSIRSAYHGMRSSPIRRGIAYRRQFMSAHRHLPCTLVASAASQLTFSVRTPSPAGRYRRRHNLNDLTWRALSWAGVPSLKEPHSLTMLDGKRPDGLSLIPLRESGGTTWGVTVTETIFGRTVTQPDTIGLQPSVAQNYQASITGVKMAVSYRRMLTLLNY